MQQARKGRNEEGNVPFNATTNPFLLNKICLNQRQELVDGMWLMEWAVE